MEIFKTKRLLIRELKKTDILSLYDYGKEELTVQYQPWDAPKNIKAVRAFYEGTQAQRLKAERRMFAWGVVLQSTNKLIGDCGYHYLEGSSEAVEIGCNIHSLHWRKGYATELTNKLISYLWSNNKSIQIFAECDSRNIASRKVLEKTGFNLETIRKADRLQKGIMIDVCKYKYVVTKA